MGRKKATVLKTLTNSVAASNAAASTANNRVRKKKGTADRPLVTSITNTDTATQSTDALTDTMKAVPSRSNRGRNPKAPPTPTITQTATTNASDSEREDEPDERFSAKHLRANDSEPTDTAGHGDELTAPPGNAPKSVLAWRHLQNDIKAFRKPHEELDDE